MVIAAKIGDPLRWRYPADSPRDNVSRSLWDMYNYNGRIYLAAGNYAGAPDFPIFSFGIGGDFKYEYRTKEESLHIYREHKGVLYGPGIDSHESWEYGNLYKKDGEWTKLRTIPDGVHVFDVAFSDDLMFVSTSGGTRYATAIKQSSDGGISWADVPGLTDRDASYYRGMAVSDGILYILGQNSKSRRCIFRYDPATQNVLHYPIIQSFGSGPTVPHSKITACGNGILYMVNMDWTSGGWKIDHKYRNSLMVWDGQGVPVSVSKFNAKKVSDMFVRDDVCYVLTSIADGDNFIGTIHCSRDLIGWTTLLEFTVPGHPESFEHIEHVWFVGLGDDTKDSGTVYRVGKATPPELPPGPPKEPPEPPEPPTETKLEIIYKGLPEGKNQEDAGVKPGQVWVEEGTRNLKIGG